jgi:hypothetical protein
MNRSDRKRSVSSRSSDYDYSYSDDSGDEDYVPSQSQDDGDPFASKKELKSTFKSSICHGFAARTYCASLMDSSTFCQGGGSPVAAQKIPKRAPASNIKCGKCRGQKKATATKCQRPCPNGVVFPGFPGVSQSPTTQWINTFKFPYADSTWITTLTQGLGRNDWTLPWTGKYPTYNGNPILSLVKSDKNYANIASHFISDLEVQWKGRMNDSIISTRLLNYELDKILVLNGGDLMQSFHMRWKRISQQNGKDAQVLPLWHGTHYTNMEDIFTNGFDYHKSTGVNARGKGIYMAKYAPYSVGYMSQTQVQKDDQFFKKNDDVRMIILTLCITGVTGKAKENVGKSAAPAIAAAKAAADAIPTTNDAAIDAKVAAAKAAAAAVDNTNRQTVYAWPKQDNGRSVNSLEYAGGTSAMYIFGSDADSQCLPLAAYCFKRKN